MYPCEYVQTPHTESTKEEEGQVYADADGEWMAKNLKEEAECRTSEGKSVRGSLTDRSCKKLS